MELDYEIYKAKYPIYETQGVFYIKEHCSVGTSLEAAEWTRFKMWKSLARHRRAIWRSKCSS